MSHLAALARNLRCPACGAPLRAGPRALACPRGHRFDLARRGHVTLPPPRGRMPAGDSAAMVAARAAFLAGGHFAPIVAAVRAAAPPDPGLIVELGAGPGHYLAALRDALPAASGIALDASRPALRRAARAHPRLAAVGCDVWATLPLADGVADLVLDIFAPRNGPEIERVLAPAGALVVVTPQPEHLQELRLIGIDPFKALRLRAALPAVLRRCEQRLVNYELALDAAAAGALVAMGPSARHGRRPPAGSTRVTVAVQVETYVR
jgi:23S rRNA (guanine745-N1)-methyltransferase